MTSVVGSISLISTGDLLVGTAALGAFGVAVLLPTLLCVSVGLTKRREDESKMRTKRKKKREKRRAKMTFH